MSGGFPFPVRYSCLYAAALAVFSSGVAEGHVEPSPELTVFDEAFMWKSRRAKGDLERFSKASTAYRGTYRSNVYVNEAWVGRIDVEIGRSPNRAAMGVCANAGLFRLLAINPEKLTETARNALAGLAEKPETCVDPSELVEGLAAVFDNAEMRVDVAVPQILQVRRPKDYVDSRYWDDGVTAVTLRYDANAFHSRSHGVDVTQVYAGVRAGLNIGPWRLRHRGNVTYGSADGGRYQALEVSASRSLPSWKSVMSLGDGYTDGALFDSFAFRGVRLASDERMFPLSERGYAPVVRGIANGNAVVRILQGGATIYETNVPAGPFEIDDLYPTGYGGDLEVEVTEADGSRRRSRLPYAAPVNALRAGSQRHSVTAGQYRGNTEGYSPWVVEGSVIRGLSDTFTGYAGVTASEGYVALMGGMAVNTRWGALGFDATHAATQLPGGEARSGQSMRISYSKLITELDTQVMLAAYRYSTSGFLSLSDAVRLRDARFQSQGDFMADVRRRGRLQLTLNQRLPWGASLSLTGGTENYWNRGGRNTQFQLGYSHSIRNVAYGVSVSRARDIRNNVWDTRVMANVSIPLGRSGDTRLSTSLSTDARGATSVQQSISGALGARQRTTYGVNVAVSRAAGGGPVESDLGGHVTHDAGGATLSGSASAGAGYSQFGVGMSGGVVAYGGGVVFASTMSETVAVVEADKAVGARVQSGAGGRIDRGGRALVSGLTPFATNEIEVDPTGLPMSVVFKSTMERAVPTAGAVVRVRMETEGGGRSAIVRTRMADGSPVPFGASVLDAAGNEVGAVSQGGRVMLKSVSPGGKYRLKWGENMDQQCEIDATWPVEKMREDPARWIRADGVCRLNGHALREAGGMIGPDGAGHDVTSSS